MRTNSAWQAIGKRDPLWGVATWRGRERGGTTPWTDADFYATGEREWQQLKALWPNCNLAGTVLEIGCGAGRMTRMLAQEFQQVIAVDVSPDMIAYASARVHGAIDWRVGNGSTLPAEDASVHAVFSCHVFQHFPDNAAQRAMLAEVYRVLEPGGTFLIHIPLHQFPRSRVGSVTRSIYRLWTKLRPAPKMFMTSYEISALLKDVPGLGFVDARISAPIFCVHGRKP